MAGLAGISLSLLLAVPQGAEDSRLTTSLGASDVKVLNRKAQAWIRAELAWDEKDSKSNRTKARKTRDSFMKVYLQKSKKREILKHMKDVLGIFGNVFPYGRVSTSGEIKVYKDLKGRKIYTLAPKKYRKENKCPMVLMLRGKSGGGWAEPAAYLKATWSTAPMYAETLFTMPPQEKGADYETQPDLTTEKGRAEEEQRVERTFMAYGDMMRTFRIDRNKLFLDCGVGSGGFGLRFATYIPSRFAGLILREPVDTGKLMLMSLKGLPILMVSTAKTKQACDALKVKIDKIKSGFVTIIEGKGNAPFAANAAEIDAWTQKQSRVLYPDEVAIAPNNDRFVKSHWVAILAAEPLDSVGDKERPFVNVKVDRVKNQILVNSQQVSEIGLYLNDALVDLDKPVTVIANGKALEANKFDRSLNGMIKYMRGFYDSTQLYSAYYRFAVPKEEKAKEPAKPGDGK